MGQERYMDSGEGYFSRRFHALWSKHIANDPEFSRAVRFPCHVWTSSETVRYANEHEKFKKAFPASPAGRELLWEAYIKDNRRLLSYERNGRLPYSEFNNPYNQETERLYLAERCKFQRAYNKHLGGAK